MGSQHYFLRGAQGGWIPSLWGKEGSCLPRKKRGRPKARFWGWGNNTRKNQRGEEDATCLAGGGALHMKKGGVNRVNRPRKKASGEGRHCFGHHHQRGNKTPAASREEKKAISPGGPHGKKSRAIFLALPSTLFWREKKSAFRYS